MNNPWTEEGIGKILDPSKNDLEKKWALIGTAEDLIKAIIFFVFREGAAPKAMPGILFEYVYCELVLALIECASGKPCEIGMHPEKRDYSFEEKLWKAWQNLGEARKKACSELTLKILEPFFSTGYESDEWGDGECESIFSRLWKSQVAYTIFFSMPSFNTVFVPYASELEEVKQQIIPNLPPEVLADCRKISVLMKKYIETDLRYIESQYRW